MNEESEDFNIEDEMNELPGYIQSIIKDVYTFDKKDNLTQNENEDKSNILENNTKLDTNVEKNNNLEEDMKLDIDEFNDFDNDKENDYNLINIFNKNNDFFNTKDISKENNLSNEKIENESKENININIIQNKDKTNFNGIKMYSIQENDLQNIKRSYRLQSILQNNINGYQTNTYECSICFRRIQNYGLLSNCNDVFCYDCIKQWRTEAILKNKREMFRRCPICNCESPMLIKSKIYVSGEEKKKKFYELKQEKKISQVNQ